MMRLSREDHGVDATTVLYSRNEFYFVGDVWMDEMMSNSKQSSYSITVYTRTSTKNCLYYYIAGYFVYSARSENRPKKNDRRYFLRKKTIYKFRFTNAKDCVQRPAIMPTVPRMKSIL